MLRVKKKRRNFAPERHRMPVEKERRGFVPEKHPTPVEKERRNFVPEGRWILAGGGTTGNTSNKYFQPRRGDGWRAVCRPSGAGMVSSFCSRWFHHRLISAAPPAQRSLNRAALFLILAFFFSGCRQDMHNQPRYEPLEQSSFFNDGRASRQLVAGTVPRGVARETIFPEISSPPTSGAGQSQTGQPATGQPVNNQAGNNQVGNRLAPGAMPAGLNDFPTPVTAETLARGQEQFNISCSPCHGMLGYGDGMVVQRGFPRPPSYHTARLQTAPNSHFYNVITNGFGRMWNYADQVEPDTRWAVIAYIRALQISQNAKLDAVPQDQRKYLKPSGMGGQTR